MDSTRRWGVVVCWSELRGTVQTRVETNVEGALVSREACTIRLRTVTSRIDLSEDTHRMKML